MSGNQSKEVKWLFKFTQVINGKAKTRHSLQILSLQDVHYDIYVSCTLILSLFLGGDGGDFLL